MTARYTHATDEAKRRAVEMLVRRVAAPNTGEVPAVQLRQVENPVVADKYARFGNVLATETKTASSASP
jgi:hypothetical protein